MRNFPPVPRVPAGSSRPRYSPLRILPAPVRRSPPPRTRRASTPAAGQTAKTSFSSAPPLSAHGQQVISLFCLYYPGFRTECQIKSDKNRLFPIKNALPSKETGGRFSLSKNLFFKYFLGAAHASLSAAKLWPASEVREVGACQGALPLGCPRFFEKNRVKLLILRTFLCHLNASADSYVSAKLVFRQSERPPIRRDGRAPDI